MTQSSLLQDDSASPKQRKRRSKVQRQFAKWLRWLHIYLSMISFAVVFFFAITGITLNHPTWFTNASEQFRESSGELKLAWIASPSADAEDSPGAADAPADSVSELEIVEYLREHERLRGSLDAFTFDAYQATIAFRAPAYSADVFIDRETGTYELVEMSNGFVALINDLHKGRDSGSNWSWLIDASAILMLLVSVTGIVLILYIKRHRVSGLVLAAMGMVLVVVVYFLWVPR